MPDAQVATRRAGSGNVGRFGDVRREGQEDFADGECRRGHANRWSRHPAVQTRPTSWIREVGAGVIIQVTRLGRSLRGLAGNR